MRFFVATYFFIRCIGHGVINVVADFFGDIWWQRDMNIFFGCANIDCCFVIRVSGCWWGRCIVWIRLTLVVVSFNFNLSGFTICSCFFDMDASIIDFDIGISIERLGIDFRFGVVLALRYNDVFFSWKRVSWTIAPPVSVIKVKTKNFHHESLLTHAAVWSKLRLSHRRKSKSTSLSVWMMLGFIN